MSELGATEKNLVRAYVFGFTLSTRTLLGAVGTSHFAQERDSELGSVSIDGGSSLKGRCQIP